MVQKKKRKKKEFSSNVWKSDTYYIVTLYLISYQLDYNPINKILADIYRISNFFIASKTVQRV